MQRYFIELAYKGTKYSGFQVQENAQTIQSEIEKALKIYYKEVFTLTGSSRTDAGVHAMQNIFHVDTTVILKDKDIYHLNAILPGDIVIIRFRKVLPDAHCRFDAISRQYGYYMYASKDPFKAERAWFYPYSIDIDILNEAAAVIMEYRDFTSFSKRNTQVNNFICTVSESHWNETDDFLIYKVRANRFLRGMVRGLVGTMLKAGRKIITINEFRSIIERKDCKLADFKTPPHGLFLEQVQFPDRIFL